MRPPLSLLFPIPGLYGLTSELECDPLATAITQEGSEPTGNGVLSMAVSWPVLGLSCAPEIELSR